MKTRYAVAAFLCLLVFVGANGPFGHGSLWKMADSTLFYNGGNVGIGTSTPDSILTIGGGVHITGELRVDSSGCVPYKFHYTTLESDSITFQGCGVYIVDTENGVALDTLNRIGFTSGTTPHVGYWVIIQTRNTNRDIFVDHQGGPNTPGRLMLQHGNYNLNAPYWSKKMFLSDAYNNKLYWNDQY